MIGKIGFEASSEEKQLIEEKTVKEKKGMVQC